MDNKELLSRLETCHGWQSKAILQLRELINNEDKFTQQAAKDLKESILTNVLLNISEMEILAMELEVE